MTRRTFYLALTITLLATVATAGDARWFNLHVTERGEATEVRLHLPVGMVLAALDAVDTEDFRHGQVRVCTDGADIAWAPLLREVREAPDGQYVTVTQPDADVKIRKTAGLVEVEVDEHGARGEHVRLRFPATVLDAFQVTGDNTVDVRALVASLGAVTGELLKVESNDADVRIWVE